MVKIYLKNNEIITVNGNTTMGFFDKNRTVLTLKRWKDKKAKKYELLYMIPTANIWYIENEEAIK